VERYARRVPGRYNEAALLEKQVGSGHKKGSWDPIGIHGRQGGRVATTALGVLCLEVYYRHARRVR